VAVAVAIAPFEASKAEVEIRTWKQGPAKDRKATKKGTLFINPGGPGESGMEEVQWIDFPQEVRDRYDIVGFDPRGVAKSQPASGKKIGCSDVLDFTTYWTGEDSPENQQEADLVRPSMDKYFADCKKRSPAWWTLGTQNVVRDLELLRIILGQSRPLNFFGSSYGTTIASEYMRMYPDTVGRMVLNSPTDNSSDDYAHEITQAKAREAAVLRFVDGYAKAKKKSRQQVENMMLQVRQWADDNKMMGFLGLKAFGDGSPARLSTEYMFTHGIMALTYYDIKDAQPAFNTALDAAYTDKWLGYFEFHAMNLDGYDPQPMYKAFADNKPYSLKNLVRNNSFEIMTMVNGMDSDGRDLHTKAERRAQDVKVRAAAPFIAALEANDGKFENLPDQPGNDWSWEAFDSAAIPDPPKSIAARVNESGKVVMVIGSRFEATTPYSFAQATAIALKSHLITYEGSGHAPLLSVKNSCLEKIFTHYLVTDFLPSSPVSCKA
jgi:pimeloyl-ACP methyl ester carboxylesterase